MTCPWFIQHTQVAAPAVILYTSSMFVYEHFCKFEYFYLSNTHSLFAVIFTSSVFVHDNFFVNLNLLIFQTPIP